MMSATPLPPLPTSILIAFPITFTSQVLAKDLKDNGMFSLFISVTRDSSNLSCHFVLNML